MGTWEAAEEEAETSTEEVEADEVAETTQADEEEAETSTEKPAEAAGKRTLVDHGKEDKEHSKKDTKVTKDKEDKKVNKDSVDEHKGKKETQDLDSVDVSGIEEKFSFQSLVEGVTSAFKPAETAEKEAETSTGKPENGAETTEADEEEAETSTEEVEADEVAETTQADEEEAETSTEKPAEAAGKRTLVDHDTEDKEHSKKDTKVTKK